MEDLSGPSRRRLLAGAAGLAGTGIVAAGIGGAAPAQAAAPAALAADDAPRSRPRVRIGYVGAHEQFRTWDLVANADRAEKAGFGLVWTSDHVQPWEDVQGHAMNPWETLALIGRTTVAMTLGSGVTCPIYRHHPTEVAQAFASLAVLNPGHVFLGVGTGEALNELASTGLFGRYRERADRLVEAIGLIRRLWSGEKTTFTGRFYRTRSMRIWDLPSSPTPILVAASGPNSARIAGRYGDGWIGQAADFSKPELVRAFERGAREAGKDPDAMPKYAEAAVVVGGRHDAERAAELWRFTADSWNPALLYEPDPAQIRRKAERMFSLPEVYGKWTVGTDPEVHVKAMQELLDAGVTPFVHQMSGDQHRAIDFYSRHVLPELHT